MLIWLFLDLSTSEIISSCYEYRTSLLTPSSFPLPIFDDYNILLVILLLPSVTLNNILKPLFLTPSTLDYSFTK